MSACRLTTRSLAILVGALSLCPICSSDADAGCMDWLFGRQTPTPAYTFQTVGPPVVTSGPITSGPITTSPVPTTNAPMLQGPVAPVAPVGPSPVGLAPNSGSFQAQRPAFALQQPAYAMQRPAFGVPANATVETFENPNVYSGLPVNTMSQIPAQIPAQNFSAQRLPTQNFSAQSFPTQGFSAQRLPIVSRRLPSAGVAMAPNSQAVFRAPVMTSAPFTQPLVTANRVPLATTLRGTTGLNPIAASPVYTSNFSSGVAPVTFNAAPTPTSSSFGSGLSRFFSSPLGSNTSFSTSYDQTPITYYRPMTSVDPVTGTTVTVQRPCSSYVQQLQRVPTNSFLPTSNPAVAPMQTVVPTQSCPTACPDVCSSPVTSPLSSGPSMLAPQGGGIGQVSGQFLPSSPTVAPIPSTIPDYSGYPSPGTANTMPLTGNPPDSGVPSDDQPMAPPTLEAGRAPLTESSTPPSYQSNPGTKQSESNPDDVYPYSRPDDANTNGSENGSSTKNDGPAIQLEPPVSEQSRSTSPSGQFGLGKQFTSNTPPSFEPSGVAPLPIDQPYSTLKPIGVPSTEQATAPAFISLPPPPVTSGNVVEQPSSDVLQPPPLPAPSTRGTSPSSLFRNTESSASSRYPASDRVSVPVREATTRHQSIQQVSRWEEVQPTPRPFPPQPFPPSRPAPVVRDNSGWVPAQ